MAPKGPGRQGNAARSRLPAASLALLLLLLLPLSALPPASSVEAGDWVIYGTHTLEDTTRVQAGAVVVMAGAVLTVRNATLEFDLSQEGGYALDVRAGGTLRMENCSVRSGTEGLHYNFLVAGRLEVRGCDISDIRGDSGLGGLEITGGDALIEDTTFHHNKYYGLFVRSGSPTIRRTTFDTQPVGISVLPGATPMIEDVVIRNASRIGLKVADAAPVVRNLTVLGSANFAVGAIGSTLDVAGCRLSGGFVGIDAVHSTAGRVEGCEFLDLGTGVRAEESPVVVSNSTFVSVSAGVNATRSAVEVLGSSFSAFGVGVRAVGEAGGVYGGSATGNSFCGSGTAFETHTTSFYIGDNTFCTDVTSLRAFHWVTLEVRAPDSSPASGATVQLTDVDGAWASTGVTDADGKVSALLEEYRLLPGGARHNVTPHTVRIDYGGQITVTQVNATPDAAVQITLAPEDPPPSVAITREGLLFVGAVLAAVAGMSGYVAWRAGVRRRERASGDSRTRHRRGPRSGR